MREREVGRLAVAGVLAGWLTSPVQAASSGWLSGGWAYSGDVAVAQAGSAGVVDTSQISRSSAVLTGAWSWASLSLNGGWAADVRASLDHAPADDTELTFLRGRAHWLRPVAGNWLSRLTAQASHYRDDVFPVNGYDGLGMNWTLGWFGERDQGVDLDFGLRRERHAGDAVSRYVSDRWNVGVSWYLPANKQAPHWQLFSQWRRSAADLAAREFDTLSLGVGVDRIRLGTWQSGATLQWREDRYDRMMMAMNPPPVDDQPPQDGASRPPGMQQPRLHSQESTASPGARRDRYLSIAFDFGRSIGKTGVLMFSAEGGSYETNKPQSTRGFYLVRVVYRWLLR